MKNILPTILLFALCWTALAQDQNGASQAIPIPIADAIEARSFGQMMPIGFSPDGKRLAYAVQDGGRIVQSDGLAGWARTGIPGWASGTDIWIADTDSGKARRLTEGVGDSWLPVWSPDGQYLAFLSNRAGAKQARLWVWEVSFDRLRQVSDVDIRSDQLDWTADSKSIALTTVPDDMSTDEYSRRVLSGSSDPALTLEQGAGSTSIVYRQRRIRPEERETAKTDPMNLNRYLRDIVLIDVASGAAHVVVHGRRIAKFHLERDGVSVAYTDAMGFASVASQQILFDLRNSNIENHKDKLLTDALPLAVDGDFSLSPTSSRASYCTFSVQGGTTGGCFLIQFGVLPGKVTRLNVPAGSVGGQVPLWDREGRGFYFILNNAMWRASVAQDKAQEIGGVPQRQLAALLSGGGQMLWTIENGRDAVVLVRDDIGRQDGFYKIDLHDGRTDKLLEASQCYTCANVMNDQLVAISEDGRRVAFFLEDSQRGSDIWLGDVDFQRTTQLTHLNPQLEKYRLGKVELIHWLSDDGNHLEGALLLPSGYQQGKSYPLVVFVYGGDLLSSHLNRFGLGYGGPLNMQLLATRGYAVLFPDAPERVGTPMSDVAKAVLPGVNKVIEMGIADPKRLAVMGHSRGGYCTLAIIAQTNRFRAAVSIDGLGDLLSAYGQMAKDGDAFQASILENGQGRMGGTPWELRDRYIENSPIFSFERIDTPVLLVHGGNDETVAPFLGDETFVALRRLGKEVEYVKYPGEGHSPLYWSHPNQMDYSNRIIRWLDSWLK